MWISWHYAGICAHDQWAKCDLPRWKDRPFGLNLSFGVRGPRDRDTVDFVESSSFGHAFVLYLFAMQGLKARMLVASGAFLFCVRTMDILSRHRWKVFQKTQSYISMSDTMRALFRVGHLFYRRYSLKLTQNFIFFHAHDAKMTLEKLS